MIELKPNGRNIAVTDENRIEYIHLVANYKLNRQINRQVLELRAGLISVIDLEWLRMFDANELRILISGSPGEIDVADWRSHCQYRGTDEAKICSNNSSFSFSPCSTIQRKTSIDSSLLEMCA